MIAILVTGPNCTGKTTAVKAAVAGLTESEEKGHLRVVYADSDSKGEFFGGSLEASREKLRELWMSDTPVIVFEGTNRIALLVGEMKTLKWAADRAPYRRVLVFATRAGAADMKEMLRARCEKAGKEFRGDYWTLERLVYEGSRRYFNLVQKWFGGVARWVAVDASYLGALALKLEVRAAVLLALSGCEPSQAEEVSGWPV